MKKTVAIFGAILALSLGGAWVVYTGEEPPEKEGVVLVDSKKDDLQKLVYKSPDAEITYEVRTDALGAYPWVTASETKKKKENGEDITYTKVTAFKAGSAADKLVEAVSPLMAVRDLDKPDDDKIESFGLKEPDTTFAFTTAGRTVTLQLGGETYGTKDRYVRDIATGKVYVVDDDLFKPLKFATSRLPERGMFSAKREEIEAITLGQGGSTVTWNQKNKDDKAAAYFDRQVAGGGATPTDAATANPAASGGGKDETFANWFDSWSKLKSTAYVQAGEEPEGRELQYEVTVRVAGKPAETVQFFKAADEWYATSEFTRGLVKLSRGTAQDAADEVDDILEGRIPPEKPKASNNPHGGPPGMSPMGGPPGMPPGMPPMGGPPGMPPRGGPGGGPAGGPPGASK